MQIIIRELYLLNFKGIREFKATFNGTVQDIFGTNGTGKTTLFDAFLWLLFGKDSSDRKDFEIKTLGPDNKPFHRMDHEVSAVLVINGEEVKLRRTFKEKWVKKRGQSETEFNGHETSYYWNEVPMKQGEYEGKITALVNESVFKLLTNTSYFNQLKWQDRRNTLLAIAGDISNDSIFDKIVTISNEGRFQGLINALNSKKSIDEYKRELGAKKKRLKDELDLIPARIDEVKRGMPDQHDYSAAEKRIEEIGKEIEQIDEQIADKSKAMQAAQGVIREKMNEANGLRSRISAIENETRTQVGQAKVDRERNIGEMKTKLARMEGDLQTLYQQVTNLTNSKNSIVQQQGQLRTKWTQVNDEKLVFNEAEFACPTCKRKYDEANVEGRKTELTNNFNQNKSTRLQQITTEGGQLGEQLKKLEGQISEVNDKILAKESEIERSKIEINQAVEFNNTASAGLNDEYKTALSSNGDYATIKGNLTTLEEEINKPITEESNDSLVSRKRELGTELEGFRKQLSDKDKRENAEARLRELEQQEKTWSNELASFEGIEFAIEEFTRARMDLLESSINGKFSLVTFKLFKKNINGGEEECCDTLINGVPYSDANTASRINAGLDIINALSAHYGVRVPVFIDNRESVVKIVPSGSQIINLFVSDQDKALRVA